MVRGMSFYCRRKENEEASILTNYEILTAILTCGIKKIGLLVPKKITF
jgi:hypothetical protein